MRELPNGLDFQNGGFTVFAQVVGDGMNLIDAYNGLSRLALDQDADDNGVRDAGPFNEVPALDQVRAHSCRYSGTGAKSSII